MPRDLEDAKLVETPERDVDAAALKAFRDAIFKHCDDGEDIPIRVFNADGIPTEKGVVKVGGPMTPIIEFARAAMGYKGTFCPPLVTSKNGWRAAEADVHGAVCVTLELDRNPSAMAAVGVQLLGKPTVLVWSGGITEDGEPKCHLHWRLNKVARTREEVLKVKRLRAMIALACKGDPTSVPPVHPIRWSGSWHLKAEPRLVTAEIDDAMEIGLDKSIALMVEAGHDVPIEVERPDIAQNLRAPSTAALIAALEGCINDSRVDWNRWSKIGMSVFNASSGSNEGLVLFAEWSERNSKYNPADVVRRWDHWAKHPADRLGFDHLRSMADVTIIPGIEKARERIRKTREAATREREKACALSPLEEELLETDEAPRKQLTAEEKAGLRKAMAQEVANMRQGRLVPAEAELIADEAAGAGSDLWRAWLEAQDNLIKLSKFRSVVEQAEELLPPEVKACLVEADVDDLKAEIAEGVAEDQFQTEKGADEILDRIPEGPFRNLCRYTYGRMMLDSPEMAVIATALATGAVTANNFVVTTGDEVNAGLNMFGILLAPSGTTKSHVDEAIATILGAAGADDEVAEGVPSGQGLHGLFEDRTEDIRCPGDGTGKKSPVVFILEDEVSDFASKITKGKGMKASSQQDAILAMMLKLFTRSQGKKSAIIVARKASSRDSRPRIDNPFLVFGGFAPPDDLMAEMNETILRGGFGNRTLFALALEGIVAKKAIDRTVAVTDADVEILRAMRAACHVPMGPTRGYGEFHQPGLADWHRYKRAIRMSDDQFARVARVELDLQAEFTSAGLMPVLAQRVKENVMKLAGLISAAEMAQCAVMMDDHCDMMRAPNRGWQDVSHELRDDAVDFAIWFVTRQVRQFARYCDSHLSGSNPIVKLADRLLGKMRAALSAPEDLARRSKKAARYLPHLKQGKIPKAMVGSVLMRSEGDAATVFRVIQTLEERGDITIEEGEQSDGGGRVPTFYELARR